MRMRIAISMRRVVDPRHGERRDALSEDWSDYLSALMPETVLVPLANQPEHVDRWVADLAIDAVILSNGNDWGESSARDATEKRLFSWCRQNGRPILGACRGFQVINAILGGAIQDDVSAVSQHRHGGRGHGVSLLDPIFIDLAGDDSLSVNSYHDQGVVRRGLASDLRPFAVHEPDLVEGFYHPYEPILGIQWHPERHSEAQAFNDNLIRKFFEHGAFWR